MNDEQWMFLIITYLVIGSICFAVHMLALTIFNSFRKHKVWGEAIFLALLFLPIEIVIAEFMTSLMTGHNWMSGLVLLMNLVIVVSTGGIIYLLTLYLMYKNKHPKQHNKTTCRNNINCINCHENIDIVTILQNSLFSLPQLNVVWYECEKCGHGNHFRFRNGDMEQIKVIGASGPDWEVINNIQEPSIDIRIDPDCLHIWYMKNDYKFTNRANRMQ